MPGKEIPSTSVLRDARRFVVAIDDEEEQVVLDCPFCGDSIECDDSPAQVVDQPTHVITCHFYGGADQNDAPICRMSHLWKRGDYIVRDPHGTELRTGTFVFHPTSGLRFT